MTEEQRLETLLNMIVAGLVVAAIFACVALATWGMWHGVHCP